MWTYHFDSSQPSIDEPVLNYIEFSRSIYGHYRPYHSHPDYHLLFCTKGRAFLRINGLEMDIRPGMLAVIPANVIHSYGPQQEGLEFWGISFLPHITEDEFNRFISDTEALTADFSGYLKYVEEAFLFIYDIANRMKDMKLPAERLAADRIIGAQTRVLLFFAKSMHSARPYRHQMPQKCSMDKVIRWMIEHYAENISLDSLAEHFALSPSHFSRKFQEAFQVSPINYLIDYRISVAKDLLIHTDKPISQIAEEVGYQNPYHFSSLFSRRTGLTPQEMRAICRHKTTQPDTVVFSSDENPTET